MSPPALQNDDVPEARLAKPRGGGRQAATRQLPPVLRGVDEGEDEQQRAPRSMQSSRAAGAATPAVSQAPTSSRGRDGWAGPGSGRTPAYEGFHDDDGDNSDDGEARAPQPQPCIEHPASCAVRDAELAITIVLRQVELRAALPPVRTGAGR